jgi:hypothetical protein
MRTARGEFEFGQARRWIDFQNDVTLKDVALAASGRLCPHRQETGGRARR